MIEVADLRKTYGDVVAVEGSTFSVADGEVFGLVGPNGAGKTTTLKMLAGLVDPTAGTATVDGYDAADPAMRATLGWLPEESPLYEEMTAHAYLRFFADLYDVPREVADERIGRTLDRLELDQRDRALGDCSKGMRRKVAIARSLINDPAVVLYDEPASGLDPLTTHEVIEFTRELADRGTTVVFSAHNLFHVESVCDRVAIMTDGRIAARGTLAEIRAEHGRTEYRVDTSVPVEGSEPVGPPASAETDAIDGPSGASGPAGERHRVVVEDMNAVESIRAQATAAGGAVLDIRTEESSLEDVFLAVAGADA